MGKYKLAHRNWEETMKSSNNVLMTGYIILPSI